MLYNQETKNDRDCGCNDSSEMPQCNLRPPFIDLEEGGAPKIDYDLRGHTCIEAVGIIPIKLDKTKLKPTAYTASTATHFHKLTQTGYATLRYDFLDFLQGQPSDYNLIMNAELISPHQRFTIEWLNGTSINDILNMNMVAQGTAPTATTVIYTMDMAPMSEILKLVKTIFAHAGGLNTNHDKNWMIAQAIANYITDIIARILEGYLPTIAFQGGQPFVSHTCILDRKSKNSVITGDVGRAYFTLLEHYRICSFEGKYGMGRVVKTLSLLPSEKMKISIRTYKNSTITRTKAENVLDSYTENSASEFQHTVENENTDRDYYADDFNTSLATNSQTSIGAKVPVKGVEVDVNQTQGNATNTGYGVHNVREQNTKTIDKTLDRHTASSSRNRQISINTTTNEIYTEGEEETITREIENINKSRVLNFVYRQMNQQFLTITYLHDVSFVFSKGLPETEQAVKLSQLPQFLESIFINAADAQAFLKKILMQLAYVSDHKSTMRPLIECETFTMDKDICTGQPLATPISYTYPRVKKNLSQILGEGELGAGLNVPGIVLSINEYVLPTDDVICEALLAGGEALDCYNIRLQQAAVTKVDLENEARCIENHKAKQAIEIINNLKEPQQQAELYKKVFGTCCDVPQVGCGCNTCKDAHIEPKTVA